MSYQKLYVIDRASFLLDAQLLSSQTSGTFTGSSGSLLGTQSWNMPAGYKAVLTIENEQILLSAMSISGGVITCTIDTRGYNNTTAATHSSGVTCEIHLTKAHVDAMQEEVGAFNQGYIFQSPVTTVVSATQHTITGDLTSIFTAGRAFLFKIGSTWYRSVIRSSSYGGGTTTINITGDGLPGSGTVAAAGFEFLGSINKPVDYVLIKEASAVPADNPPSGYSWIFAKGKGWFMKDSDGKVRYLSRIRATASSSGGVLTLDWSLANVYDVTLTENITGVTHQNGVEGESYTLRIKQHASTPKTVTLGTSGGTRFCNDQTSYTVTADASAYDVLGFTYNATDSKFDLTLVVQGFQASPSASAAVTYQPYGDGSDGACTLDGTNTYGSILSKSGSTYTALRDLFLTDLTFSGGAILDMAGFKLHVNGTASGTGTVRNNGSNGENGNTPGSGTYNGDPAAYGGAAGAAGLGVTVPRPAASGAGGRGAYQGGATAGTAGSNTTISYTTTSGAAGGGGADGGGGGAGGTVAVLSKWRPKSPVTACQWFHFSGASLTVLEVTPGSGGGGGGGSPGGAGYPHGSGGGGGGGAGGYVYCAIRRIQGSITFEAKGGNGGNGGNTSSGTVPKSGGGGAGGNGGMIFLMFDSASGYTTNVSGGTGGTGGTASGGTVGASGSSGNSGTVITLQLT